MSTESQEPTEPQINSIQGHAQTNQDAQEKIQKWKEIAFYNPRRLARVLELQHGQITREGDTPAEAYPILEAIKEIVQKAAQDAEDKTWDNLVSGGIADALCNRICMTNDTSGRPEERTTNEPPSSYWQPLEIFYEVATKFKRPPTRTDQKVVATLRRNWAAITTLVWNRPENTLRPEESYVKERTAFSRIVLWLLARDTALLNVLYGHDDLTVQIIARHWKYSRHASDMEVTASVLYALLEPQNQAHASYVNSNGLQFKQTKLIHQIFLGVSPPGLSDKVQQAKAYAGTLAEHLVRPSTMAHNVVNLLIFPVIFEAVKKDATEPELWMAVLQSMSLWNALIRLLRKGRNPFPTPPFGEDRSPPEGPEKEMNKRVRIMMYIMGILNKALGDAHSQYPKECESLLRNWVNGNLFDALEDTIDILVQLPTLTMQMTFLFMTIERVLPEASPPLKRTFAAHLPRWKILGTLVGHDTDNRQDNNGMVSPKNLLNNSLKLSKGMPNIDVDRWDHEVWRAFGRLQFNYVNKTMCGKRGCGNAGYLICECQAVKYCSEVCKTKDERDHKLMCGRLGLLEECGIETSVVGAVPLPVEAQTTATKKKKKSKSAKRRDDAAIESPCLEEID